MCALIAPLACFVQIVVSAAVDSPCSVVARRRTIRSYAGTVAVK